MSFLLEPGDLARTPLAALLLEGFNLRATGVLAVEHGGGTSRLFLRDGAPVGAQVFAGFRPLGHVLLQTGKIDMEALSRSLATMAETGRPQGEILVEMGAVAREDVAQALAEQQAGYFAAIAALESGAFRFEASSALPGWTRGQHLSPLRTIVDTLERPQAERLVISALQPAALGAIRLASNYPEAAEGFRWTAAERALVDRLRETCSLDAFFGRTDVPPERARAMLAALLLLGLAGASDEQITATLELQVVRSSAGPGSSVEGADAPAAPSAEGGSTEPAAPAASPAVRIVAARPAPSPAAAPPAAPSPPPAAPPVTPVAAAPPAPGRRSDPGEARARRQRLLHRAMQNMGIGPFAGRPGPTAAEGAPAAPPPAAPPPAAPAGAPGAAAPGPAEAALRKALLAVAPRAREKNLFARLGIPETASRDEVKQAYLAMAKQFHPDRIAAGGLTDLAEVVRDFFTAVNEAYETLSDDRKRAEYLLGLKGIGKERADGARVDFQKGEACFRTRDFARARGFYESAIRADPRPEYQAALAYVFLVDPQGRDRAKARALLDEATQDPKCDRAFYTAGILARDEGDEAAAERMFRAALEANARHPEAVRELRLIQARRSKGRD